MSDELNKDAEFLGNHEGKEDPILIAQRYLNIFHQIHIFNDKRKKEFDDSLLQLPSNIRVLLSTLPGGSILIDHIRKIEEKNNLQNVIQPIVSPFNTEKSSSDTLKKTPEEKRTETQIQPVSNNNSVSGDILRILQQNQLQHVQEMKTLIEMMAHSQENLAGMFKEILETKKQPVYDNVIKNPVEKEVIAEPEPIVKEEPKPMAKEEKTSEKQNPSENKEKQSNKNNKKKEEKRKEKFSSDVDVPSDMPKETNNSKEKIEKVSETIKETKNNILNLTKKLFTKTKTTETEKSQNFLIDQTPVSLDDFENTPVELNSQMPLSSSPLVENSSDDEDWDWEYIEDTEDTSNPQEDWEYVEEPEVQPETQQENWEYAEEPEVQPETQQENWEYAEEPEVQPETQQENWEYAEEPEVQPETQQENWEYVEEPEVQPEMQNGEWEYPEGDAPFADGQEYIDESNSNFYETIDETGLPPLTSDNQDDQFTYDTAFDNTSDADFPVSASENEMDDLLNQFSVQSENTEEDVDNFLDEFSKQNEEEKP